MNQQLLDLHLARLRNPPVSNTPGQQLDDQVKRSRLTRLDKSKVLWPYFLPFLEEGQNYTVLLNGIVNDVLTRYTPVTGSPTLITGMISDFDTLKVRISDVLQNPAWQDFATQARDVAGVTANLSGHHGYLDLEEPFELAQGSQLSLDIINTTGGATRKWWICSGLKVSELRDVSLDVFDRGDMRAIKEIESGIPPRPVNLYLDVPFSGAANQRLENLNTKQYNHPLLIWGISTNLKNCSIEMWDSVDHRWMPAQVPIWAVAALNTHASGRVVHRLKKPVYHAANVELRANVVNTFDPTIASDVAGSICFHCSTP